MHRPRQTDGSSSPNIALVAGEVSGDLLGAALLRALRQRFPQARLYGVAGPEMIGAGCEAIESIDQLSVMGLAEVLPAIPRLLALRRRLVRRFVDERPDLVIGLDAPDFNLGLERRLRSRGLRTMHVVSPSVWAWRRGRVKGIVRAAETLLCLLPFEPAYYDSEPIHARYIGHPLADEIDADGSASDARATLGLAPERPVIAVLPGSRGSELKYLSEPFVRAAALLKQGRSDLQFVTPLARPALESGWRQAIARHAPGIEWKIVAGQSQTAMQAADVVLLASGTATLECLLLDRPMVVAYRGARLTAWLMLDLGLLKSRYVSLPNLLANAACVPELLQDMATPEALRDQVLNLLERPEARRAQSESFARTRELLRCDAARRAADEVARVLRQKPSA